MQLRSQLKLPSNKFKLKKLNLQKRDVRQNNPQVQNKPQVQKNQHMKDRTQLISKQHDDVSHPQFQSTIRDFLEWTRKNITEKIKIVVLDGSTTSISQIENLEPKSYKLGSNEN